MRAPRVWCPISTANTERKRNSHGLYGVWAGDPPHPFLVMNRPPLPAFQPVLLGATARFQPLTTAKRMSAALYQMKPGHAGVCVWDSDEGLPYIWTGQSWSVFSIGGVGGTPSGPAGGTDISGTYPDDIIVRSLTFEDGAPFVVFQNRWWLRDDELGTYRIGTLTTAETGSLQWIFDDTDVRLYADIFN